MREVPPAHRTRPAGSAHAIQYGEHAVFPNGRAKRLTVWQRVRLSWGRPVTVTSEGSEPPRAI